MNRVEHIAWCKSRALQYCDAGELQNAFSSLASDLGKHDETKGHAAVELGMGLLMSSNLDTQER